MPYLDRTPLAVLLRNAEAVRFHGVEHRRACVSGQAVGTERDNGLALEGSVGGPFVVQELIQRRLIERRQIAGTTETRIARCQRLVFEGQPALNFLCRTQYSTFRSPLFVSHYLHLAGSDPPIEVGDCRAHCTVCALHFVGTAGNPPAGFVAFQSGLEVRDQSLGELFTRVVELTHVITWLEPIKRGGAAKGGVHSALQVQLLS
jgi:hypothetical protein